MRYQYIIIHQKHHDLETIRNIESLLNQLIKPIMCNIEPNYLLWLFEIPSEVLLWEQIILSMSSDFFTTLSLFESKQFDSLSDCKANINDYHNLGLHDVFKSIYCNYKTIHKYIKLSKKDLLKQFTLGKYAHDSEMIKTIKAFLENNQQTVLTAKKLFLHRNSLSMRLEKFELVTGFNIKKFIDAYYIYSLLID